MKKTRYGIKYIYFDREVVLWFKNKQKRDETFTSLKNQEVKNGSFEKVNL